MATEDSPASEQPRHAGLMVRLGAALIDAVIMGAPVSLIVSVIFRVNLEEGNEEIAMATEDSPASEQPRHAGLMVRLGAALIDAVIMGAPVSLIVSVIFRAGWSPSRWLGLSRSSCG